MNLLLSCLLALLSMNSTITAAALPQVGDSFGAQFSNGQDAVFSAPYHSLPATSTAPPRASTTAPLPQDQFIEEQALALSKASSATNTTFPNITTANDDSTHPNSQNRRLQEQAVSLVDNAVSAANATVPHTNPQPVKAPAMPAAPQTVGAVPQANGDGGDNGLLAQANGIEFGPTPISSGPASPSTPIASSSSSSTTPTTVIISSSTILPSSTTSSLVATPPASTPPVAVPQDNGLQAQDSGSMNIDFDPTHNATSTNYPHEVHNSDGTLVVASVQDSGLQAQDAGGANVVWAPGEAYEGGLGGDVNVPQVVDGGVLEQREAGRTMVWW